MNRFLTGLAVVLVVVAAGTVVQVLHGDPETTRPPHVVTARPGWSPSSTGRSCVGPSQLDRGHFWPVSPWGGPGACADLDPNTIDGQAEYAPGASRTTGHASHPGEGDPC